MKQDFKPIRPTFIPEREFTDASGDTRLPTEDDFMFIVYPDDNNDEYDGPHIYEHGELRPLIPDDSKGAENEASGQSENTNSDQQCHTGGERQHFDATSSTEEGARGDEQQTQNDDTDESGVADTIGALRED